MLLAILSNYMVDMEWLLCGNALAIYIYADAIFLLSCLIRLTAG